MGAYQVVVARSQVVACQVESGSWAVAAWWTAEHQEAARLATPYWVAGCRAVESQVKPYQEAECWGEGAS